MIKNLIFDVGGVLLSYRWKDMLMDFGLPEAEALRVGTALFEDPDDLWLQFNLGNLSDEEILAEYCRKYPADTEAMSWFVRHGEYMHVARPAIWKLVHKCKEKGYRIYLLSNYSENLFRKHTQYADFLEDLDGMMVSYMIHKIKPDRAIYEALCQKYELLPEECLFFDDRLENVEAARAYGMSSIQVLSAAGLAEDLRTGLNGGFSELIFQKGLRENAKTEEA